MQKFHNFLIIAGIAAMSGLSACNVVNPAEIVPTYVHIDSFTFTGNARFGSSSNKITNVWVYFNSAPVGIFDLPVTFPVMATGPGTLLVLPGIDFSGLRGYEVVYPFYDGDTMNLSPAPGATRNFAPDVRYSNSVALPIPLLEQFDEPTSAFSKLSGDTSLVRITGAEAFEGGSGLISLPPGKDSVTLVSRIFKITPNVECYLELNYKSNIPIQIGMTALLKDGTSRQEYLIGLKDRSEWGKVYIGLRDFISANQGPEYRILLRMYKFGGVSDAKVYFDNVKVLSF